MNIFRDIDTYHNALILVIQGFFVNFSIFLTTIFSYETPIYRDRIHAYNSVPSVERIKLLTIIEAKMGQKIEEGLNAQLFIKLYVVGTLIKL